ncbi:LysM peptidoglycan-binding domain-containing protein [Levilactobacillus namurensis]|uniref:LysM peptidoglycan-binding domain-containing protein n=1 Tax=Levilactobacillus namurensis TaxID=380393 RepID=UPI0026EF1910|nr:LysM peptidoglycan-binding domain-containing protein [Levilactobacillus namurensis]
MATKKTLKSYQSAMSKAKTKYNKAKTTSSKDKKALSTLKNKLAKAKTAGAKASLEKKIRAANKSVKKANNRVTSTKNAYTKAKNNLATFKKSQAAERRKASLALKKKIIAQMQKDKPGYWAAGRPFVIPKYPRSISSYVYIDNSTESETTTVDMTTNSIAPGQYINHYTQMSPVQRQIDGKLGGSLVSKVDGLKKQFDRLKRWSSNGTELELHHGQRSNNSVVLTSVAATFDAPLDNAVPVSISIQDIKWAKGGKVKSAKKTTTSKKANNTGAKTPTKGDRSKAKPKAGKYLTIKSGDTYWGYHVRFGTSISKLRSWNGYPDRRLPIGKKVRVK